MFKECYALEKIHGTSAWLSYTPIMWNTASGVTSRLDFFAGGGKHEEFIKLFDAETIRKKLDEITPNKHVQIYGEYYGGKMQKMSKTYGDKMRFVVFEVKIGGVWLNVPKAEEVAISLGLDFVHYTKIPTTMEAINAETDADSVQAVKNGMVASTDRIGFCPPKREGIVLRPLEEVTLNNGERVIAKHKRNDFRETKTPREISPEKLKKLEEAKAIADEWVTRERLNHILNRGTVESKIENTGKIIALMTEDILRESKGEIVDSPNTRKQIAKNTALLFKEMLRDEVF